MFRTSVFVGLAMLGMAFMVSTGASQDKKDAKAKASYVPPGWKALALTKDQSAEFAKIHTNYKAKIKDLEDKIQEVKAQEKQEMFKLLTVDQKDKYRKLVLPDETAKDKKVEEKAK